MPIRCFDVRIVSVFAITACTAGIAHAQATSPSGDTTSVDEIIVTGQRQFLSADTSGTTGLPLSIEKVPQSITLISPDFIKTANLKNLNDVAQYTAGALNTGNFSGEASNITLRGFAAQRAVDGINTSQSFEQDFAIFDRIEVVKGPSSVVYGVSSPGGVVNFVTKSAGSRASNYLYGEIGSFNSYRAEGQLSGSLDKNGDVHALGVVLHDRGDSFTDSIKHRLTSVYGALDFKLGGSVSAYLHGGYQRSIRSSFDGIPAFPDGTPAPLPRSFFVGTGDRGIATDAFSLSSGMKFEVTDFLELDIKGVYQNAASGGSVEAYGYGLDNAGNISFTKQRRDRYTFEDYGISGSLTYKLDGLGLKDSFITAGILYQDENYHSQYSFYEYGGPGNFAGTGNIFNGEQALTAAIDAGTLGSSQPLNVLDTNTLTFTSQSIIKPASRLSFLFGGSYSIPKASNFVDPMNTVFKFKNKFSARAGVTYDVARGTDVYFSYSESFLPQQFLDVNNNVLAPLTGAQYEVGAKHLAAHGKLLLTAALYQITQANAAVYDATVGGIDRFRPLGSVRHRGGELQATGQLTSDLQVSASYSYLDAKVLDDSDPTIIGKRRIFLPHNSASLLTTYTIGNGTFKGVSVGAGVRYVGSEPTSYDETTRPIGSYVLGDALIGYDTQKFRLQFSVKNLLDKYYFTNTYQSLFFGNQPGAPRTFLFSVRYGFGPGSTH